MKAFEPREAEVFQPGDWATWAYMPRDESGPYNDHWRRYVSYGHRGAVEDRLLRYEPPPYLVLRVIQPTEGWRHNGQVVHGNPYALGLELTRKREHGGVRTDMRHFAASYFVKVPPEMVEELRQNYLETEELYLYYTPPIF